MGIINMVTLDFIDEPFVISNAPEFVLKEKLATKQEVQNLAGDLIGLQVMTEQGVENRFPLHTPANVFLSLKAFEKNAHKLCDEAQRLVASKLKRAGASKFSPSELFCKVAEAADLNIPATRIFSSNEILAKAAPDNTKLASLDDSFFGLVNGEERKYPLCNRLLIKTAEDFFEENFDRFSPKFRKEFAEKIMLNAGRIGHNIKLASIREYGATTHSSDLELDLNLRKNLIHDKKEIEVLNKLALVARTVNPYKFAKGLEAFDKSAGIDKYWDKNIADPYKTTFGITKTAEVKFKVGNKQVTESQLYKLADSVLDGLESQLGQEAIQGLKDEPLSVFPSLPRPYQELIVAAIEATHHSL